MADRYQNRPFPADDDYGRDDHRAAAESDPLAELARLIGQTDPFGHVERGTQTAPTAPEDPADHYEPQDPIEDEVAAGPPPWIQRRMAQPDPPQDVDASPHPVLRRAAVYPDTEPHVQHPEPESYRHPEPESFHQPDPGRYDDALFGRMPSEQGRSRMRVSFPARTIRTNLSVIRTATAKASMISLPGVAAGC